MPGPAIPVSAQQVRTTSIHPCEQCRGSIELGDLCWAYNSKYWHYGGCPSSRSKDSNGSQPAAAAGPTGSGQREDFAIFVQVGFQGWVRADRAEKLNKAWLEAFLEARK